MTTKVALNLEVALRASANLVTTRFLGRDGGGVLKCRDAGQSDRMKMEMSGYQPEGAERGCAMVTLCSVQGYNWLWKFVGRIFRNTRLRLNVVTSACISKAFQH